MNYSEYDPQTMINIMSENNGITVTDLEQSGERSQRLLSLPESCQIKNSCAGKNRHRSFFISDAEFIPKYSYHSKGFVI